MAEIDSLERALVSALGAARVSRDPADIRLLSQDVFYCGEDIALIVRPEGADQVATVLRLAARHGVTVVTRGGGMSYSGGYITPDPANALVIDMRAMNRILTVDADDMYVIVEPGCTWLALHERLDPLGLRTPYWGTLSGRKATVGGSISQNSIFWGSGRAGSAVDSVIGLEVVTGTGAILRTGSLGVVGGSPFFRHFGPDLTGLFTADAGAHGVKTAVILRLERKPALADGLSFLIPDAPSLCALMGEVARTGCAAQQMALDDGLKTARMSGGTVRDDLRTAWQVARNGRTWLAGAVQVAGMAWAGRRLLDGMPYSLHLFVEGGDVAAITAAKGRLRGLARGHGAREVAASVPQAMLAAPFPSLNGVAGPAGERWVPVHCIMPLSRALAARDAIAAVLVAHGEAMARHGVTASWLFTTIGNHGFVIEPMFFWLDALGQLHRDTLGEKRLARLSAWPDAPDARALVTEIRQAIVAAVDALGGVHIQLGSFYPYGSRLQPPTRAFAEGLRRLLDPDAVINPGALGA